jgi:hypothetical protein
VGFVVKVGLICVLVVLKPAQVCDSCAKMHPYFDPLYRSQSLFLKARAQHIAPPMQGGLGKKSIVITNN